MNSNNLERFVINLQTIEEEQEDTVEKKLEISTFELFKVYMAKTQRTLRFIEKLTEKFDPKSILLFVVPKMNCTIFNIYLIDTITHTHVDTAHVNLPDMIVLKAHLRNYSVIICTRKIDMKNVTMKSIIINNLIRTFGSTKYHSKCFIIDTPSKSTHSFIYKSTRVHFTDSDENDLIESIWQFRFAQQHHKLRQKVRELLQQQLEETEKNRTDENVELLKEIKRACKFINVIDSNKVTKLVENINTANNNIDNGNDNDNDNNNDDDEDHLNDNNHENGIEHNNENDNNEQTINNDKANANDQDENDNEDKDDINYNQKYKLSKYYQIKLAKKLPDILNWLQQQQRLRSRGKKLYMPNNEHFHHHYQHHHHYYHNDYRHHHNRGCKKMCKLKFTKKCQIFRCHFIYKKIHHDCFPK